MSDDSQGRVVHCRQPGCGRELIIASGAGGFVFFVHRDTMLVACVMGWENRGINCSPRTPEEIYTTPEQYEQPAKGQ